MSRERKPAGMDVFSPRQSEMPFAVVQGRPLQNPPEDLYIPPDALEILIEAFEGPLDLLLYLIKRQNLDILDIPIAKITRQYMDYIAMMKELRLDLAAEYLVMAAMLAEIKSRMLLPRPVIDEDDEIDPRAELIRRLQEYERFKNAALEIDTMPRMERDFHAIEIDVPHRRLDKPLPEVDLKDVALAFAEVARRADLFSSHHIVLDTISVREKMSYVLERVKAHRFIAFTELFTIEDGRLGVVVTFIALLELIKESLIDIVQGESFDAIHLKARSEAHV